MATHRIPSHLSEGSQTWAQGVRDERELTASEWRLVTLAAEAYDRAQTARRTLSREGLTVNTPIVSKKGEVVGERISAHPAAAIARDNAALFSKLLAQLGLDVPPAEEEPGKEEEPEKPGILLRLAAQAS